MEGSKVLSFILIIVLILVTGFADSQGFVHASYLWEKGKFVWPEAVKSALGFTLGVIAWWITVKFLQEAGVISPEVQTIGWFVATIIGVAIASGKFFQWTFFDQILAVSILFAIGVLILRTNA